MNSSNPPLSRGTSRFVVAAIVSTTLLLSAGASVFAAPAEKIPNTTALSDQAAKLPLEHAFAKQTSGENKGLYALTLKNTSAKPLKVSAVVDESVVSHNRPKVRTLPPQTIEPGKTWTIEPLAAHDKVALTAEGFAPLNLTVP